MKVKKTKTVNVIEDYTINYENGVNCYAQIVNDKLITYEFTSKKLDLEPVENIEDVLNVHWSKHYDVAKLTKFENIEDLKNFKDFDNLYYLGVGRDGMVKDRNGKFISSVIILDDIFCSICAEIGTPKIVDEVYDIIHQHEWIKKIDKVEIPYYNQDEGQTHTLVIEIKPTSEVLNEILTRLKEKYISDMVKLELMAIIGYDR